MLYNYRKKRLPGPGAENLAFLPAFGLPIESFIGAASGVNRQLHVTQSQQVYQQHEAIVIGFEGTETGTMGTKPLINMADYLASLAAEAGYQ